jgi:N-acetylneuraminic acid mutarotase
MMRRLWILAAAWLVAGAASAQNTWSSAGATATGRAAHTFTALADGRGLLVGGRTSFFAGGVATVDVYDPVSNTWSPAAPLPAARADHSATLLADGRLLVVGGCASGSPCNPAATSALLYDPSTDTWSAAGALRTGRALHTANLLADGRVIVFGGLGTCNSTFCATLASTEIYDPATNAWTDGPALPQPRLQGTSTTLADGRVLVAGGCSTSGLPCAVLNSIIYNPATQQFGNAATMTVARTRHTAVRLATGDVLVAGGVNRDSFTQRTAEIWRAATNTWTAAPDSVLTHFGSVMERLPSGDVIVAGGTGPTPFGELYAVADNTWAQVGSLAFAREDARIARLAGGQVVVTGGLDANFNGIAAAERFQQGPTPLVSLAPGALDFGYQALRTSSPVSTLTVRNLGAAPLAVGGVSIGGAHAGDFSVTSHCAAPVAPGGSCDVDVRFRPQGLKDRSAVLVIADNAPNSPHQAPLAGYGYVGAPNFWAPAGTMHFPRYGHTLTTLPDGRALAVGGSGASTRAEIHSGGTWQLTPPMAAARFGHTSTRLADGRVLAAGGAPGASAEIYDAASDTWTPTGAPGTRRSGHAAALLASGRVIVFGGCDGTACNTTEVFDPATHAWTPGPTMAVARVAATATVLADGRVLVAGGSTMSRLAEVYDPATHGFSPAGSMAEARGGHTANRLPDGSVLVAGGCGGGYCASTEIFSPATRRWRRGGPMTLPRVGQTAATLADGRVLVAGGIYFCEPEFGFCFSTRAVDIYNPANGRWIAAPLLLEPRASFASTVLPGGRVLASGGRDDVTEPRASAETMTPTP